MRAAEGGIFTVWNRFPEAFLAAESVLADKRETGSDGTGKIPSAEQNSLSDLDRRIYAAREAAHLVTRPENEAVESRSSDMGVALRLSSELVGGVLVGAAIGWGLDRMTGWSPICLIIFLGLGTVTGVRNVLRSVREFDNSRNEGGVKQDNSGQTPADDK